jgi:restriction system protein
MEDGRLSAERTLVRARLVGDPEVLRLAFLARKNTSDWASRWDALLLEWATTSPTIQASVQAGHMARLRSHIDTVLREQALELEQWERREGERRQFEEEQQRHTALRDEAARRELRLAVERCLSGNHRYVEVLLLKRRQLTYPDEYGDPCEEEWLRALDDFIRAKMGSLTDVADALSGGRILTVRGHILDFLRTHPPAGHSTIDADPFQLVRDATQFERACLAVLESCGFCGTGVGGPGDQGADVIATRRGLRVVVQCKWHGRPVGNTAVQEVAGARGYHRCAIGIVVGRSGFTKAARALAHQLDIHLVDARELRIFLNDIA